MIRLRDQWPAKRCILTNLPTHKQAKKCLIFESRLLLEVDSERVVCISVFQGARQLRMRRGYVQEIAL
jgi:hypothetical protein